MSENLSILVVTWKVVERGVIQPQQAYTAHRNAEEAVGYVRAKTKPLAHPHLQLVPIHLSYWEPAFPFEYSVGLRTPKKPGFKAAAFSVSFNSPFYQEVATRGSAEIPPNTQEYANISRAPKGAGRLLVSYEKTPDGYIIG